MNIPLANLKIQNIFQSHCEYKNNENNESKNNSLISFFFLIRKWNCKYRHYYMINNNYFILFYTYVN